jgi:hypothetical protein
MKAMTPHPTTNCAGTVWRGGVSAAALIVLLGATPALAASEIGVAAAVNPEATGLPTGGEIRTIVIGDKLTFKERVETSGQGLVQVLLRDGSTFTVGPNSDLVIDEFVYDPKAATGKLVATFSKGVMRFVGGKLSKNEGGVQIKTPVGLMGIRGGVANVNVTPEGSGFLALLYGEELTLLGPDGDLQRVYERGYGIDISQGLSGPVSIRKVTAGEAKLFISQLAGRVGTTGGATTQPTNENIQQSGVTSQGSDNDPNAIAPSELPVAVLSEASVQFENTVTPGKIIGNTEMRVLSTGAQYTVTKSGGVYATIDPVGTGIVGSNNTSAPPDPAGADQQTNFAISSLLNASATLLQGPITVPYPILQGTYILAGAPSPFGTLSGTVMVGANADFLFYRLFADGNIDKPVYIIGGDATPEAKLIGTGDVRAYKLDQDARQGIDIPFATAMSAGTDTASAFVSDLFLVRPDGERFDDDTNAATKGTPVALQASFQIDGSGTSQFSTLVLGVGNVADETVRLGGARRSSDQRAISFSGNIDAVKGANDAQMFGPDGEHFVVGPDLENGKVFVDTPDPIGALTLNDLVSATIHVATLDSQTQLSALTRTSSTLTGFAAGMPEFVGTSAIPIPYRSTSSNDLTMVFDAANNTLGGQLLVRENFNNSGVIRVAFGDGVKGNALDGPSAMVDDATFAAGPNPATNRTTLIDGTSPPAGFSVNDPATGTYVVSSALVGDVLPDSKTPCECKFLKWGYWGTRPTFDRDAGGIVTANVHTGTWAAGTVAQEVELPTTGSATYDGHAVGNVTRDVGNAGGDIRQYLAAGDLHLEWNFGSRSGAMNVNNFDGLNLSGAMTGTNLGAPTANPNAFAGALTDGAGVGGTANGAFVSPVVGAAPLGVLGAFDVRGTVDMGATTDGISAGGVFVGERPIP